VTLLVEDRALLDAFRRGESKAIAKVYHAYVDQVAGMLRKGFSFMSGGQAIYFKGFPNAWDLECAVQDAFISAFSENARQSYDGINPFGPYLMTIARNRVISQLRSDMREYRRRNALSAEPPKEDYESPEQEVMRAELEQLVAEFEGSLTGDQASFFLRRYREDHNLLEAARLLGLTRMRARTLDKKVRQAFTKFLRDRGYVRGSGGGDAGGLLTLALGLAA
jgi:RNA polymerase sigma-70 factor, ECF subfamily